MKNLYLLVVAFFLFVGSGFANTQQKDSLSFEKRYSRAERYLNNENYEAAIDLYEGLIKEAPDDPMLYFYLGYCYLNTTTEKDRATKYLKKAAAQVPEDAANENYFVLLGRASEMEQVPLEAKFYLGRAYHLNYKFQEAIDVYNSLLSEIPEKSETFQLAVKKEIEECKSGIDLTKHSVKMEVTNIEPVNTKFTEHSPVISADEKTLIFTSLREGTTGDKELNSGQYREDIYIAKKVDGNWEKPKAIGSNINTKVNEATISLTTDGKQLYIYRDENKGSIFYSKSDDGKNWSEPEKLGKNINTKARETHAAISADGRELFFTSDRKRQKVSGKLFKQKVGQGGMDIYVSKKLPDGTWGEPKNLGSVVNTPFDEEGPFIHPNGTLYFSSQGHNTIGGFDIFSVTRDEEGNWTDPENLGYPINSTEDDVFYVVSANNIRAYYASEQRQNESKGKSDIYVTSFARDNIANLAALNGKIIVCDESKPEGAEITVIDPETEEVIGIYHPDPETGEFLMLLNPQKYQIIYEKQSYTTIEDSLEVTRDETYINTRSEVELEPVTICRPQKEFDYVAHNVMFGLDEHTIDESEEEVYQQLKSFAEFLKANPDIKVKLHGHCCAIGTERYNKGLSERRANFIKNYLLKNGASEEQIETAHHSFNQPIAINYNADGSYKRESMKFNRRVEFEIIESPEKKIKVEQLQFPDKFKIQNKEEED